MIIVSDTKKCTGCRACELACSYHHRQVFAPAIASIHAQRDQTGSKVKILLYQQTTDGHLACNCPRGHEMCVYFCPEIAKKELRAILQLGNKQ